MSNRFIFILVVIALTGILVIKFNNFDATKNALTQPVEKNIKYRLEVTNKSNEIIKNANLFVALPASIEQQKIQKLNVSAPYQKLIDNEGNVSLQLQIDLIAPYQAKYIDIMLVLEINRSATELIDTQPYTMPSKFVESQDSQIVKQAKQLSAGTSSDKEIVKKAYTWVTSYLSDTAFISEDRGALYALKTRKADCTGFMYLYSALLRANDIPVRMISGFIVKTNKKLKAQDYHNWVEVYIDGEWRLVDPQKRNYMKNEEDYVTMRIINNNIPNPHFSNAQQLFAVKDKRLKVTMD